MVFLGLFDVFWFNGVLIYYEFNKMLFMVDILEFGFIYVFVILVFLFFIIFFGICGKEVWLNELI